jgi:hypothetical protein
MNESRRRDDACLSDLVLDQLLVDALDGETEPRARGHLDGCDACRARYEAIVADRERFRAAPPPLRLAPAAVSAPARAPKARPARAAAAAGGFAIVAAAAAVIFVTRTPPPVTVPSGEASLPEGIRTKSATFELSAVAERGAHQLRLAAGDEVRPGDRVQLAYSTSERGHLYVLGVDGTGAAQTYFPEAGATSSVEPGREVELPFSLVLDDKPGPERFFGFLCGAPHEPAVLASRTADAVRRGVDGEVEVEGCSGHRLELSKR